MNLKIIFNPTANQSNAKKQEHDILYAFEQENVSYTFCSTTYPKHAIQLAMQTDGYDGVVACGGDGTINEVITGLLMASAENHTPPIPLGIIPIGTGNDFYEMLGESSKIRTIVQKIAQNKHRPIDIGLLDEKIYFDNNCGLAMEALVTAKLDTIHKKIRGIPRYVLAVAKALRELRAWKMHIKWDTGELTEEIYLFSVANGPRTGSTFLVAPNAKIDDGYFDVVIVPKIPFRTVLQLLPKLLNGSHLTHPAVQLIRTKNLHIQCDMGTPIHTDGELIAVSQQTIQINLQPQQITLFTE